MRKSLSIIALVLIVAVFGGCDRISESIKKAREEKNAEDEQRPKPPEVVFPVEVTPPERRDMHAFLKTSANVEAERRVDVISEGVGRCLLVTVEEGDTVKAGQVLAELEKADLDAQVRQSEVNVRQQEVAFERTKKLRQNGLASDMEYDNARFALEQARATLESLEVRLGNQTLRAPIDGVVTHRNIQKGMLVSTGTPAFTIVDPSSYVLPIYIWEGALHRVAVGQEAEVTADSLPGEAFKAVVRRINPGVEQGGKVKVVLDFDAETRARFRDGLYARVRLITDLHKDSLVVAKDAVVEENARTYLMVVEDAPKEVSGDGKKEAPAGRDTGETEDSVVHAGVNGVDGGERKETAPEEPRLVARRVEVKLGLEDAEYVEIVSGIAEGARVITLGQHTVKPGARVRVTTVTEELTANAEMSAEEALKAAKEEAEKKQKGSGPPGPDHDRR